MKSMKILVVEDEKGLREALVKSLTGEGYLADGASDGEEGYELIRSSLYDLVILDVMLPVLDGYEVLRRVRNENNPVPVIMLTARTALDDKLTGIDLGADDYMTKPFAMQELLARIRMVTRRGHAEVPDTRLKTGDLILDTQTYLLSCSSNTKSIRLPAKEYQMMEFFMRNPSHVLSRDRITERVWGYDSEAEYNNVDVYISFLRKKLAYIKTNAVIRAVRGAGYVLETEPHD